MPKRTARERLISGEPIAPAGRFPIVVQYSSDALATRFEEGARRPDASGSHESVAWSIGSLRRPRKVELPQARNGKSLHWSLSVLSAGQGVDDAIETMRALYLD